MSVQIEPLFAYVGGRLGGVLWRVLTMDKSMRPSSTWSFLKEPCRSRLETLQTLKVSATRRGRIHDKLDSHSNDDN